MSHIAIVRADLSAFSERTLASLEETLRAVLEAVPAIIRQHAPDAPDAAVRAIVAEVEAHAYDRLRTLDAARELARPGPD